MKIYPTLISCIPGLSVVQELNTLRQILHNISNFSPLNSPEMKQLFYIHMQRGYQSMGSSLGIWFQATIAYASLVYASSPFFDSTDENVEKVDDPQKYHYAAWIGGIVAISCLVTFALHQIIEDTLMQIEVK
ncbi:MAG: hypothetical protein L0207_07070 [Chlamydiae bacterium]|nr:hypothetical protein [Chlamydiota bacterium]